MTFRFSRAALLVGMGLASGVASATPCSSAISSYESAVSSNAYSSAAQILSNHPECFGGSATTSQVQINGTSFQQVSSISRALGLRFASDNPGPRADTGIKGMAAGNAGKKWNVWGSLENNDTRQSYVAANTFTTRNDSDVLNSVFGVDYSLSPTMVFGVSMAFDKGDVSGRNSAPGTTLNNIDTDGYAIAPYIGIQLSKSLFFDASIGFGKGEFSSNTGTAGDSDRWFGAANLGYERWMGNLQFTGKASYLRAVEDHDNTRVAGVAAIGTGGKNTLGQVRLTGQLGYWLNGAMPYASLGYVSDVERKSTQFGAGANPIGKDGWVWSLGVNFISLSSGITGGIAYKQEESRSNQQNKSLMANIAFRF